MPIFKRYGKRVSLLVRDVMSSPVITISQYDSLNKAVQLMWNNAIGSVVVVDSEGKLVGIITERDIIAAVAKGIICKDLTVKDVMSKNVITITPDEELAEAIEKMRQLNIRHLPVIDREAKPIGVVSLRDLLDIGASFIRVLNELS